MASSFEDPSSDGAIHPDPPPPLSPPAAAPPLAARVDEPGGYRKAMATCDGIAVAAPLLLSAIFLAGQGVLYFYANVDTTFPAELHLLLGAVGLSAAGYVTCGPATHLAHGHVDRAALSLLVRPALPAAAIGLTYLLVSAATAAAPPGDHFGPSGGEAAAGLVGGVAIIGAFAGAVAIDYSLAARPRVTPAVSPAVAGGITAGLRAQW